MSKFIIDGRGDEYLLLREIRRSKDSAACDNPNCRPWSACNSLVHRSRMVCRGGPRFGVWIDEQRIRLIITFTVRPAASRIQAAVRNGQSAHRQYSVQQDTVLWLHRHILLFGTYSPMAYKVLNPRKQKKKIDQSGYIIQGMLKRVGAYWT